MADNDGDSDEARSLRPLQAAAWPCRHRAVIEATPQGIAPFCLTVNRHAAGYLPGVFGAHQYALLSKPSILPSMLLG